MEVNLKNLATTHYPPCLGIRIGIATVIGLTKQIAPNLVTHIVAADGEIDADADTETD